MTPKEIQKAYLETIKQVARLAKNAKLDINDEFFFSKNPSLAKKVDALLIELNNKLYSGTVSGIKSEWGRTEETYNDLAKKVFAKSIEQLPAQYYNKIFSNNDKALQNFINRKFKGLGLSDRIWKNTQRYKQELELGLEIGIGKGQSAASLATELKQYLINPDKLFRRVLDKETGVLRLSKAAKAYNPGRGVYRSSYKNALRLTRNEINFSYEGAALEKRKQQDFIVGIEIKVSPSHQASDDKGGISCLSLQGKYPKDFDFTSKWHVNCKCQSFNIVKSLDELTSDLDQILAGNEPTTPSKNAVNKNPASFVKYVKQNEKTWTNWKNKPRFLVNK